LHEACPHFPHFVYRVSFGQVDGDGKRTARVNTNIHSDQLTAVESASKFACPLCLALSCSLSTNYWQAAVSIDHSRPIVHPFDRSPYIYSCGGMSPFPFCILTITKRKAEVPTFLCLPASRYFTLTAGSWSFFAAHVSSSSPKPQCIAENHPRRKNTLSMSRSIQLVKLGYFR